MILNSRIQNQVGIGFEMRQMPMDIVRITIGTISWQRWVRLRSRSKRRKEQSERLRLNPEDGRQRIHGLRQQKFEVCQSVDS